MQSPWVWCCPTFRFCLAGRPTGARGPSPMLHSVQLLLTSHGWVSPLWALLGHHVDGDGRPSHSCPLPCPQLPLDFQDPLICRFILTFWTLSRGEASVFSTATAKSFCLATSGLWTFHTLKKHIPFFHPELSIKWTGASFKVFSSTLSLPGIRSLCSF